MSEDKEGWGWRWLKQSLQISFEDTNLVVVKRFMGKLLKFSSGSGKVPAKHLSLYSHVGIPKKPRESLLPHIHPGDMPKIPKNNNLSFLPSSVSCIPFIDKLWSRTILEGDSRKCHLWRQKWCWIDNRQSDIKGPNIISHQICLTRFYQNPGHPAIQIDYNTLKN